MTRRIQRWVGVALWLAVGQGYALAAELSEAEDLFRTGKYDQCAQVAGEELADGARGERWWHLKIRSEAARGKYKEARETLNEAQENYPSSIPLQLLGYEVLRRGGHADESATALALIEKLILLRLSRDPPPEVQVALGRFFALKGADARQVMENFFTPLTKQHPNYADGFFASAELALDKHDYALVAETLRKAPKSAADDSRYHYLMARAFAPSNRAEMEKHIDAALKINPNHVDSMLLRADRLITAEEHEEANALIERALKVDPLHPDAWAYRAVLAHLKSDPEGEAEARKNALSRWSDNPEVDHLIGRKLSQDYRFAEGAEYQRRALKVYSDYLPAKVQLCQDLLRLGREEEGWELADEIFTRDGYNVVAFNLVTLRDNLNKFATIEDDEFILRMDPREAELYGKTALEVLKRARKTLCEKYDVEIDGVVIVEIFPRKQDFAVRTFGLPGADGFLGVCFGRVITANSPASQGEDPSNWEAVLWHEFCHTVTLHKTHNKMPRWLSEGISVYEELQQNPGWGQWMTPRYREMTLGEDLTPLSDLSSAFLAPKSALHIQFAYYESALAVEFLIERFGFDAIKAVLDDLGAGLPINEALVRRTAALDVLDQEFTKFARDRAREVAPDATWEEPELPREAGLEDIRAWLKEHPKNFPGLQRLAVQLILEEEWTEAEQVLKELKSLYPSYVSANNAYGLLAAVYKETARPDQERTILEELATRDADVGAAYRRLMELSEADEDWEALARNARRLRAVNPLIPAPHRGLAKAAEELGQPAVALDAYGALLRLGDPDMANLRYQRAKLLKQTGQPEQARREVLMALEVAPRFLDAHRLLIDLVENEEKGE